MLVTIIIFIIVLGVLVFVHEFGHFFVARKSGMKVDEFGFGFPPRIAGIQKVGGRWKVMWGHKEPLDKENTVYSVNWIPFGGFVKILGENNEGEEDPRSFINRPFWGRFLTLVAGVAMNWILAVVLFSLVFAIGVTSEIQQDDPVFRNAQVQQRQVAIADVRKDSPAEKAGIQPGDIILSVDGKAFSSTEQASQYIRSRQGETFNFTVKRINETKEFQVSSLANPGPDQGPTGVALADIGKVKLPWYNAIRLGFYKAINMTVAIFSGLWHMFFAPWLNPFISLIFKGQWVPFHSPDLGQVGGPLKIAQLTGQVAQTGFTSLLNFMGLLSINLAILNILPIPALDGGRVLLLLIEKIRRKRNNQMVEQWVNTVGFVALLMLMVLVTAKDISGLGGIGHIFSKLFGK